jgi:hypothetical protein
MMTRLAHILCVSVVLALAVGVPSAQAERPTDHDRARAALEAGEVVPLRDVMAVATDQFAGDMVEAELDRKGPFWIYRITVIAPDGTILKLDYDAATTALVRARGHDVTRWFKGDPKDFPDIAAARTAMRGRVHEQWDRKWHGAEDGWPPHWLRRWWRQSKPEGGEPE